MFVFGKFDVLYFLETPALRFTLLPYYRRFITNQIITETHAGDFEYNQGLWEIQTLVNLKGKIMTNLSSCLNNKIYYTNEFFSLKIDVVSKKWLLQASYYALRLSHHIITKLCFTIKLSMEKISKGRAIIVIYK